MGKTTRTRRPIHIFRKVEAGNGQLVGGLPKEGRSILANILSGGDPKKDNDFFESDTGKQTPLKDAGNRAGEASTEISKS